MKTLHFCAVILAVFCVEALSADEEKTDLEVGSEWNESVSYIDEVSGLPVLRLTTKGVYNQGPTVHLNTAFSGGSDTVIFASLREGRSFVMSGDLKSGKITVRYKGSEVKVSDDPKKTFDAIAITGINCAGNPKNRDLAFITRRENSLRIVNLDSNETKTLIEPQAMGDYWLSTPVFSQDGNSVAVCAGIAQGPQRLLEKNPINYLLCKKDGKISTLFQHEWGQTHIFPNPADSKLWIVKCGKPSHLHKDRDAAKRVTYVYILNSESGELKPILPRNNYKDITHLSWNGRGDRIVYHGDAEGGGNYVGAMKNDGTVIWEHVFKDWTYGDNGSSHIAGDPAGDFIVDDGLSVRDQISLIDYSEAGSDGMPKITPLAKWKNDWTAIPGQFPHPHPAVSPDGKRVVFYGCKDKRVDVYAIDISSLRK